MGKIIIMHITKKVRLKKRRGQVLKKDFIWFKVIT